MTRTTSTDSTGPGRHYLWAVETCLLWPSYTQGATEAGVFAVHRMFMGLITQGVSGLISDLIDIRKILAKKDAEFARRKDAEFARMKAEADARIAELEAEKKRLLEERERLRSLPVKQPPDSL